MVSWNTTVLHDIIKVYTKNHGSNTQKFWNLEVPWKITNIPWKIRKMIHLFIQCKLLKIKFLDNNLAELNSAPCSQLYSGLQNFSSVYEKLFRGFLHGSMVGKYWFRLSSCYFKSLRSQCTLISNTLNLYSSLQETTFNIQTKTGNITILCILIFIFFWQQMERHKNLKWMEASIPQNWNCCEFLCACYCDVCMLFQNILTLR
jgi:hypothetical protein